MHQRKIVLQRKEVQKILSQILYNKLSQKVDQKFQDINLNSNKKNNISLDNRKDLKKTKKTGKIKRKKFCQKV